MSEYTAAIVGTGHRGREHALAYDRIDGAVPVACMARSDPRREELAAEFDMAAYDDLGEMLSATDPDVVHVCTPPSVRVDVMEAISAAGVPAATVEKPVAVGVEDWRALRELEARTETKFAVCHQFRWQPHLARCREAVASGALGEVEFLDCSGRLVLTDQGTHCLHYANSLNGDARIKSVFGNVSGDYHAEQGHPGHDGTQAMGTFENGVRAAWATGDAGARVPDAEAEHEHIQCVAYTDAGHARWEMFGDWEIVSADGAERGTFGGEETYWENRNQAQADFQRAVLRWLAGGDPVGTNLERSLHEWKAVLALYESALSNESVRLDAFDPKPTLIERVAAES